ncbi:MAG: cyclic nucleotide-binding domain-containing protein [Lachnospiraceae bacterium]|nr:cyclic nucleotide-binding domain-containing protein [Lachnospiraceae bacterium]
MENGLNSKMIDIFRERGFIKRFKAKEIIFQKNDTADYIYLLTEGKVRAYSFIQTEQNGRFVLLKKGTLWERKFLARHI